MDLGITGRRALVTGGARGIGFAIAHRLAVEGAKVVAVDRNFSSRDTDTTDSLQWSIDNHVCDVTNDEQVGALVQKIEGTGGIDILVNAAGIEREALIGTDDFMRKFDEVMNVNVRGTALMTHSFKRLIRASRHGRILNIGSIAGERGNTGQAGYSASKSALRGLTFTTAREVAGRRGATCNMLALGYIESPMTAKISDEYKKALFDQHIILGRFGQISEVAAWAVFLCSVQGAYMTGQVVRIDGGLST